MPKAASRVDSIPPYLFARLDKKKEAARNTGIDLIDLSIGDPDIPTPAAIVKKAQEALANPSNHHYPGYQGTLSFRKAAVQWYKNRFGIALDPENEIVALIGSKEGIFHLPWVYLSKGDVALIPSPGYPVYKVSTLLAGGTPYMMPLYEKSNFLPDLENIPSDIKQKAKICFLNYPNNPTGAHGNDELYERAVYMAKKYDILICHDAAYSEITYDRYRTKSILEYDSYKKYSIEFHSLSKTYCMTGWRIGFAVGNREAIHNLMKLKSNIDSGVFTVVQEAAVEALTGSQDSVEAMNVMFARRRDMVVDGLNSIGISAAKPLATFYIWAHVPKGYTSVEFCEMLIEKTGVVVTPGSGFGDEGEGYFRVSITSDDTQIAASIERLRSLEL
jgi:LL-diaminopimelate aminotransferase